MDENLFYTRSDRYREKYFRVPEVLIYSDTYKKMPDRTKLAYAILLKRQELSLKNEWYDQDGRIYFIFSREKLAETLQVSPKTATEITKDLQKYQLLFKKKMGQGLPDRMYLLRPKVTEKDIYIIDSMEEIEQTASKPEELEIKKEVKKETSQSLAAVEKGKSYTSRSVKVTPLEGQNLPPSKRDIKKTDFKKTEGKSVCITSEDDQKLFDFIETREDLKTHTQEIIRFVNLKKKNKNFKYDIIFDTLEIVNVDEFDLKYLKNAINGNLRKGFVIKYDQQPQQVQNSNMTFSYGSKQVMPDPKWADKINLTPEEYAAKYPEEFDDSIDFAKERERILAKIK